MKGFRFVLLLVSAALIYFGGEAVARFYASPESASSRLTQAQSLFPGAISLVGGVILAIYAITTLIVAAGNPPRRGMPVSPAMESIPSMPVRPRTLADIPAAMTPRAGLGSTADYDAAGLTPTGRPLHGIAVDLPNFSANGKSHGNGRPQTRSVPPLLDPYANGDDRADGE